MALGLAACMVTSNMVGCAKINDVKANEVINIGSTANSSNTGNTSNTSNTGSGANATHTSSTNNGNQTVSTDGKKTLQVGKETKLETTQTSHIASGASKITESEKPYIMVLQNAVTFYDANKCGKEAGDNNTFAWRSACHTGDGSDVGLDLSGGYHDCGDHVKFGITQGYSASVLGWSYYNDKASYEKAGLSEKTLATLKHFTNYLLKCHPNSGVYYYQVGDGNEDHAYWGAPEAQGSRKVMYKVDKNTAGSDVAGQASAALSLMYLNYKDIDATYAAKCLSAAKSLYVLGNVKQGTSQGQSFYNSTSYKDDLAWAAVWLYEATGEQKYLADAKKFADPNGTDTWTMCWDNMKTPVNLRLYASTKEDVYLKAVKSNIDYWRNSVETTKGGLKYLNEWGVLRYAAAEAMIAMHYYQITGDETAKSLATSQINYILGDNPNKMSYLIGYGDKYPLHPHHRGANGYTYANGGNLKPAKNLLLGALVGGPDKNDQYRDNGNDYVYTEVGIDYNAGFVGAIAAMLSKGVVPSQTVTNISSATKPAASNNNSNNSSNNISNNNSSSGNNNSNNGNNNSSNNDGVGTNNATNQQNPISPSNTQTTVSNEALSVTLTNQVDGSVNQQYTIQASGKESIDLSKLKICYYYSKQRNKAQSFWCDHAGLELSSAPWYEEVTTSVKGTFYEDRLEITFDSQKKLPVGKKLQLGIRTMKP